MASDTPSHPINERVRDLAYERSKGASHAQPSLNENWLRAKDEIRKQNLPSIEQASERIKPLADLATRFVAVVSGSTVVLTLLGWLFLIAYVLSVGALFPPIDSSMSFLVLLVAFVFGTCISLLAVFFVGPFLIKRSEPCVREIYPSLSNGALRDYFKGFSSTTCRLSLEPSEAC